MDLDNRMISAEWLKNKFYEICDECNSSVIFIDRIIDEIDDAPDVKVVRCKDCTFGVYAGFGKVMCDLHPIVEKAHFYCASGERKDNG